MSFGFDSLIKFKKYGADFFYDFLGAQIQILFMAMGHSELSLKSG